MTFSQRIKKFFIAERYALLLVFLLLLHLLLRIPTFLEPAHKDDPNFFITVGRSMLQGKTLFRDIDDIAIARPGLAYIIAGIAGNHEIFQYATFAFNIISILLFWSITQTLLPSFIISFVITSGFVIFTSTPFLEGNHSMNELYYLPFGLMSLLFLFYAIQKQSRLFMYQFLIGYFLGIGFLIKITAIFYAIAIGIITSILLNKEKYSFFFIIRAIFYQILGFVISVFIFFLSAVVEGANLSNIAELTRITLSLSNNNIHIPFFTSFLFKFSSALFLSGIIYAFRDKLSNNLIMLILWTAWAISGSYVMNIIGLHYTLIAVPGLLLTVGYILSSNKREEWIFAFLPIIFFIFGHFVYSVRYPSNTIDYYIRAYDYLTGKLSKEEYYRTFSPFVLRNYAISETLKRLAEPKEEVLVWGIYGEIYNLSETLPVIKYVWHEHVEMFDYYDEMIAELEKKRTRFIVITREYPQEKEQMLFDYMNHV